MRSNSRSMMRSFAPGGEQDLAIARGKLLLGEAQRMRGETQGVMDGAGERQDRPMRRSRAKYMATASTMNHSSQAAGDSNMNNDMGRPRFAVANFKSDKISFGPPSHRQQK
jgi:hypothetical protein